VWRNRRGREGRKEEEKEMGGENVGGKGMGKGDGN